MTEVSLIILNFSKALGAANIVRNNKREGLEEPNVLLCLFYIIIKKGGGVRVGGPLFLIT